MQTGIVTIGRNEGERLRQSLLSIDWDQFPVVYVDSGSTDGSVALAESLGCEVVNLDLTIPFTAARARNEGFERLISLYPDLMYVQFIDGDCELDAGWIPAAIAKMKTDEKIAVVCGRRREKFPNRSVYNRLVDMEWNTPVGEAAACGGDALMRVAAFQQVDGYDEMFAAGEEPEMCFRMRKLGWRVWRIDAEMTRHDAALTSWRQWWTRNKRSGSAYAQGVWRHGRSSEKYDVRDSLRIWLWGGVVPFLGLLFAPLTAGFSIGILLFIYAMLVNRIARYRIDEGDGVRDAIRYGVFNVLGKFPQLHGQIKFLHHRRSTLIEYKDNQQLTVNNQLSTGKPKPTIAYVLQYFPKMSETFVYREVKALREQGFEVVTLSNRTPDPAELPDEARYLMNSTEYAVPIKPLRYLKAHLYWWVRHPLRYLGTLLMLIRHPNESWNNRRRTLQHFLSGVYLTYQAKDKQIDHIHAHFAVNASTIALVMSRLLKLPFSFTVHQVFITDQIILKEKLKSAKFIISISQYSINWLINYAPEIKNLRDKFHIVHCGISPEQFRPNPSINNRENGTEKPIIFSVSRWDEKKGVPYLVEACRILRERGVPFHCIIGGDGDERPIIESMIAKYGLGHQIELPGYVFQEDLQAYHDKSTVFVLPCITASDGDVDGIPVALMEAMAKQLPVISTTVSGIPELITNNVDGLVVAEKDAKALADGIQFVLENRDVAERLGKAARIKVSEQFNVDKSAAQIVDLIQNLV